MKPAKNGEAKSHNDQEDQPHLSGPAKGGGKTPRSLGSTQDRKNPLWNFRDISPEDQDYGDESSKVKHNIKEKLWPFNAEEALENYQMT